MKSIRIIQAGSRPGYAHYLRECWQRRDLVMMLLWRDLRIRYVQTWLGMLWAVVNPAISILLLLFVFNVVARVDHGAIPAIVFITSGLCVWSYFSKVVSESGDSLLGAQSLIKRIYFPRLVIPLSKAIGGLVDFVVVLLILLIMLWIYDIPFSWRWIWFVPGLLLLVLISLGCGVWASALNIRFRDFHHIVPVVMRIGLFVTPVAYGTRIVPEAWRWMISINPLAGLIDGFRWILFATSADVAIVLPSFAISLLVLLSGLMYFIHMEKYIADIL